MESPARAGLFFCGSSLSLSLLLLWERLQPRAFDARPESSRLKPLPQGEPVEEDRSRITPRNRKG